MNTEEIVSLVVAFGGGATVIKFGEQIFKALTGRSAAQRAEMDRADRARREAEIRLDAEVLYRRQLEETLTDTRQVAIAAGLRDQLPAVPSKPVS